MSTLPGPGPRVSPLFSSPLLQLPSSPSATHSLSPLFLHWPHSQTAQLPLQLLKCSWLPCPSAVVSMQLAALLLLQLHLQVAQLLQVLLCCFCCLLLALPFQLRKLQMGTKGEPSVAGSEELKACFPAGSAAEGTNHSTPCMQMKACVCALAYKWRFEFASITALPVYHQWQWSLCWARRRNCFLSCLYENGCRVIYSSQRFVSAKCLV